MTVSAIQTSADMGGRLKLAAASLIARAMAMTLRTPVLWSNLLIDRTLPGRSLH